MMMMRSPATTAVPADPCCFIVFGASGDLAHRLLAPALYNLAVRGLLPEAFAIIGVARAEKAAETFRTELEIGLRRYAVGKVDDEILRRLLRCVGYVAGGPDDPATYQRLKEALTRVEPTRRPPANPPFYLATPPSPSPPLPPRFSDPRLAPA